jgi:hypothetical protein
MAFTAPVDVLVVAEAKIADQTAAGDLQRGQRRHRAETEHGHHGRDRRALPAVLDHQPVAVRQRRRDGQQQHDLDQVGHPVGVLERVRRVGVEEPTAIGAEFLDGLLGRHQPALQHLAAAVDGGDRGRRVQVLDDAAGHQHDRGEHRQRQ